MPSTTTDSPTVIHLADWTDARSAHGPTLAMWLRQEAGETLAVNHPSLDRGLRRIDHQDHYVSFWTADRYCTELNVHPAMAPLGTWSHTEPLGNAEERRRERERKQQRKAS